MARVVLVAGLGFGDEGKGSVTDFLCRQHDTSLVVRYSGGAQAAHNVLESSGRHHTFAQFGSGTFTGARTLLSRHMLVNPLALMEEQRHLQSVGVENPYALVFVERGALVTNPFQVATNRLRELSRNNGRHGSCGMGIGETGADFAAYGEWVLRVRDLEDPDIMRAKLRFAQDHKVREMAPLVEKMPFTEHVEREWSMLADEGAIETCVERYVEFTRLVSLVDEDYLRSALQGSGLVVFEGAQGVLLDQFSGFFPYVTRSTISFANALELLEGYPATRLGVTRTYATRHGAGPFVTEDASVQHPELHNDYGPWQQSFRQGHFDFVATRYAIRALGGVDQIALTHLDRAEGAQKVCIAYDPEFNPPLPKSIPEQECLTKALLKTTPQYGWAENLEELVSQLAPISITSHGPTADDKVKHETRRKDEGSGVRVLATRTLRAGGSVRPLPLHV